MKTISSLLVLFLHVGLGWSEPPVTIVAAPDGGIQPQAVGDAVGTLHLIYFKGDPAAGNLFYVQRPRDSEKFSSPLRVNSTANSAVAVGSVRGGQLAIGKNGRAHIVWFGSNQAKDATGTPLCYSRLNDAGTAFEPQRNLIGDTRILDGGGSVAADNNGNVCLVWHALKKGATPGEENRRLWIARSADEGKTFAPEEPVWNEPTGACACCSTKALVDSMGQMTIIYRGARNGSRDVFVLGSADHGKDFERITFHPWRIPTCPMSTFSLTPMGRGVVAAWETNGRIFFSQINPGTEGFSMPQAVPEGANQKHPAVAVNSSGEMVLVWTEGTGWQKGGALVWQVYDKNGNPTQTKRRVEGGIPVWGLPTVVATEKGFTIFH
jgi:hypothetical protein